MSASPHLSVVVKCFNEEAKIERCLRSLLAHTAVWDTEIILVDSRSTDASVALARAFPIRIVQLAPTAERRIGAVAQLGYQVARGRFLLLIDGDMELMPGFLPDALACLEADGRLAGVGGLLIETSQAMEYRERELRPDPDRSFGLVAHLTGLALYRRAAIEDVGYFTDRNLHSFEERELGARMRARSWHFRFLPRDSVRHHGHSAPPLQLLLRRWRTRYLDGYGELIRAAWGTPYFRDAAQPCLTPLLTLGWWATELALLGLALRYPPAALAALALGGLPLAAQWLRKRSFARAWHSFLNAQFAAASLLRGLASPRVRPTTPVDAVVLQEPPAQRANAAAP